MKVILTQNSTDLGFQIASQRSDCDCDCVCACPVDNVSSVLPLPVAYYLELTPYCNNKCPGCGNTVSHNGFRAPILDLGQWNKIIDDLAAHANFFKLTGGEPTLYPKFFEIIKLIDEHNIHFTLFSNARWNNPGHLLRILENTDTCDGVLLSLHGPDDHTHQAFSNVPGSFAETIANIKLAASTRIDTSVSLVINKANYNKIAETMDLVLNLGATQLVCNRLLGNYIDNVTPTELQLQHAIDIIESLRKQGYPIRFGNCIPQCFSESSSLGCTAGSTFASVDPWGRVRPCNHTPLIAGNLLDESMDTIWHNDVMAYWRGLIPQECTNCSVYGVCRGGCRAQAATYNQAQDPLMKTPLVDYKINEIDLKLYEGLHPVGRFNYRFDADSSYLVFKNQIIMVPDPETNLVPELTGKLTLRQIEQIHGPSAIKWIGALHQSGMISWQES